MSLDPWASEQLDAFIARHEGRGQSPAPRASWLRAVAAPNMTEPAPLSVIRAPRPASRSRARRRCWGARLAPFQWAAVRYALDARRVFLAHEQGLARR